ncbi:ADP-ribosylglycohydrolase family protein [Thiohalorhabdus methylotrophus]|uniref:ADP-ribosylglycohydrolase family protein n=1 Tax=Thiohalorhabdus methylotrophus TaxID=3242694 RepID=A0ABV4TST0_9GAMM
MEAAPDSPIGRARLALEGLSVGDAFGERFFAAELAEDLARGGRPLPDGPWTWTDDTAMALGIFEVLREDGEIHPDRLAAVFSRDHAASPGRGYGPGAKRLLEAVAEGGDWRELAGAAFGGAGSMGNGGAMRAAPLGAFFAGSREALREQADRSARVTHAHTEGRAGAIAVAAAAAAARDPEPDLLGAALAATPEGPLRRGLETAAALPPVAPIGQAVATLGNGSQLLAADTVPFALWCAARHLGDFTETLWATVSGGGDRDTTCAIAGGVAALAVGPEGIPEAWRSRREALPTP